MTATISSAEQGREFEDDVAILRAGRLREKYRKEAFCHANMMRRERQGKCEIDASWREFRTFLRDMGPCLLPDGSIDRINNDDRRYGPGLCRWATKQEQTRNRSNTRWGTFNGERLTVGEFVQRTEIPSSTVHYGLTKGLTLDEIARRRDSESRLISGRYVPLWADTDEKRLAFEVAFGKWHRMVKRRDRKALACREAFEVVRVAVNYSKARDRLDPLILELHPDDEAEFFEKYSELDRIRRHALDWAQHAARAMYAKHPDFALKLFPRDRGQLKRTAAYADWFTMPPDDWR